MVGTIGAIISGLAGGGIAALVAPRLPFLHAAGVLILLAIDTASVLAKGRDQSGSISPQHNPRTRCPLWWMDHCES
jgi:hypothetical protein